MEGKLDDHLRFFDLIGDLAHKRYSIAERELRRLSIKHTEAKLLSLVSVDDGCKQDALAAAIVIDRSNVGRSLKRLEERGYIRRVQDSTDKRSYRVFMTEKGFEQAKKVREVKRVIAKELCKNLSKKDAKTIVSILNNSIFSKD